MPVDSVKNAAVASQVERRERENARKRRGVEFGMDFHFIRADRYDALKTFFLLEKSRLYINEPSFEQGLHLRLDFVQFLLRFGVKRNIQSDIEYLLVGLLKVVPQLLEISVGGIKHRAPDEAFFFPSLDLALNFRHFFLELS